MDNKIIPTATIITNNNNAIHAWSTKLFPSKGPLYWPKDCGILEPEKVIITTAFVALKTGKS